MHPFHSDKIDLRIWFPSFASLGKPVLQVPQTQGRREEYEVEKDVGCGGKEGGIGVARAEMESGREGGRSDVRGECIGRGSLRDEGEGERGSMRERERSQSQALRAGSTLSEATMLGES